MTTPNEGSGSAVAIGRQSRDLLPMQMSSGRPRVVAVLGPTNTGKTHLAMERMLGHESGMIGFPLRLLARENYDRAVKMRGAAQVALITGEEKIVPPQARYFLCTVESMPVDRSGSPSSVSTRSRCAPIPTVAISSPTACCTPAAAARPCSWAPKRSNPFYAGWCPTQPSRRAPASRP